MPHVTLKRPEAIRDMAEEVHWAATYLGTAAGRAADLGFRELAAELEAAAKLARAARAKTHPLGVQAAAAIDGVFG